ncbi:hypothetical protein SCANM63S_00078 [Streptomyces canarius]
MYWKPSAISMPERWLGHRHADAEEGERPPPDLASADLRGRDHAHRRQRNWARCGAPSRQPASRAMNTGGSAHSPCARSTMAAPRAVRAYCTQRVSASAPARRRRGRAAMAAASRPAPAAETTIAIRIAGMASAGIADRMRRSSMRPPRTSPPMPDRHADRESETRRPRSPMLQRDAQAVEDGREHVAPLRIGAEPMAFAALPPARRISARVETDLGEVVAGPAARRSGAQSAVPSSATTTAERDDRDLALAELQPMSLRKRRRRPGSVAASRASAAPEQTSSRRRGPTQAGRRGC